MTPAAPDLVYLCDWLPPDFGAVGQYSLLFARERARRGEHVVLYGLSSIGPSLESETIGSGSLKVVRLAAKVYDRTNVRARAAWTLRANLSLLRHAFNDLRLCKEILFTGSPPFMLHFVAPLNLFLRKKLTYRVTDFFPECLMAEYPRIPLVLRLLYGLTSFWRRRVNEFQVLGEDQHRRLIEAGMPARSIVLKRNPSPVAIPPGTAPLVRPRELANYRILLYSGNFGVAHDYETFLAGYRRHHREGGKRVALWLNGIGRSADALEDIFRREGLPHLRTRPLPLERLARLLVTPDAHLITLLDRFAGFVLPSKVHACIESRKRIIYIGPAGSDVHLLCRTRMAPGSYVHIAVGDSDGVLQALENM